MNFFKTILGALLLSTPVLAADVDGGTQPEAGTEAQADDAQDSAMADKLQALEDKVFLLEQKLFQQQELKVRPRTLVTVSGYVDFGFFAPQGNGTGVVQDFGNLNQPQLAGKYSWVFLGDLLSTAVNSRGEAADLGELPGANRFDSIHSRGAPGFIVNEVNLGISARLTDRAIASTSVNFAPRSGSEFSLGDFIDVDTAQLEWMPTKSQRTSIFVGKFDSVIGIEYRERKASQKFGITPTLIARYTTGTPLGVKIRSKFLDDDRLVVAAALTNGSSTTEQFHFYNEIDTNAGKTGSGRLSYRLPIPGEVEIGLSGEYGPQDHARDSADAMWFWGVDAQAHAGPVTIKAQYLKGKSPGEGEGVYSLKLNHGGYVEADVMATPWLGLYGRGEVRDAFVTLGDSRAYLTKSWRAVGGVRAVFTDTIVLKAEYLKNGEYGGLPDVRNDLFTSSLLLIY